MLRNLAERVADLEVEGPRGLLGGGSVPFPKPNSKSVLESKLVTNLAPPDG